MFLMRSVGKVRSSWGGKKEIIFSKTLSANLTPRSSSVLSASVLTVTHSKRKVTELLASGCHFCMLVCLER